MYLYLMAVMVRILLSGRTILKYPKEPNLLMLTLEECLKLGDAAPAPAKKKFVPRGKKVKV